MCLLSKKLNKIQGPFSGSKSIVLAGEGGWPGQGQEQDEPMKGQSFPAMLTGPTMLPAAAQALQSLLSLPSHQAQHPGGFDKLGRYASSRDTKTCSFRPPTVLVGSHGGSWPFKTGNPAEAVPGRLVSVGKVTQGPGFALPSFLGLIPEHVELPLFVCLFILSFPSG